MMTTPSTHPLTGTPLKEGKAKVLYPGPQANEVLVVFKDSATAFNGEKKETMPGKGRLNAQISAQLFTLLNAQGLATCFSRHGDEPNTLVYQTLTMMPLEIVVRNIALGSVCKRYGLAEGHVFRKPIVEYFLKNDTLNDPALSEALVAPLQILPGNVTLTDIEQLAFQVNEVLWTFFQSIGITCADFKLEMGQDASGSLKIGDELSPDNFRLRDTQTGQVLDKDVFRLGIADLVETYQTLKNRMDQAPPIVFNQSRPYQATVTVNSRANILSPESRAILTALNSTGFESVETIRSGKRFELSLQAVNMVSAIAQVRAIATDVLSNPVIEDVQIQVQPMGLLP